MTAAETAATEAGQRPTGLRLARIHLRMGLLGLARAELEAYAGRGDLDDEALLDLAEVRWRTGDLTGAGEVANAYLGTGRTDPVALVIAAEAVVAAGRPGEARRLAGRALESVQGSLDQVFNGMPRSLIWPADTDEPAGAPPAETPAKRSRRQDVTATLWSEPALPGSSVALPDADDAFADGREALERDDLVEAALQMGIALRLASSLAPAILDAIGANESPELDLVRGDAYRLVGREAEAQRSYTAALRALAGRPSRPAGRSSKRAAQTTEAQ